MGEMKRLYIMWNHHQVQKGHLSQRKNLYVLKLSVCSTHCILPVLQSLRHCWVNDGFLFDFTFDYHALHCISQSSQKKIKMSLSMHWVFMFFTKRQERCRLTLWNTDEKIQIFRQNWNQIRTGLVLFVEEEKLIIQPMTYWGKLELVAEITTDKPKTCKLYSFFGGKTKWPSIIPVLAGNTCR